jgi:hypothetical protein
MRRHGISSINEKGRQLTPREGNPDQDNGERDQHPILTMDAEDRNMSHKPVAHRSPDE